MGGTMPLSNLQRVYITRGFPARMMILPMKV
jgi:hypothetical protein